MMPPPSHLNQTCKAHLDALNRRSAKFQMLTSWHHRFNEIRRRRSLNPGRCRLPPESDQGIRRPSPQDLPALFGSAGEVNFSPAMYVAANASHQNREFSLLKAGFRRDKTAHRGVSTLLPDRIRRTSEAKLAP